MSLDSFVCFVIKGQPTIYEPYDSLVNLKTSEILAKMKYDSQYLCIHTPLYVKPLQMDSFPIKDFKELSVSKKYLNYDRPDYYLTFEPTLNYIEICVTPKIKPSIEIPPYFVKFAYDELSKMTSIDVRNTIQQQFGFSVNSSKLYFLDLNENEQKQNEDENLNRTKSTESIDSIDIAIENQIISDEISAQSIIDDAQSRNLYVFFDLPDETISKLKKRVNIISEIISTEKTYINDLTIINDHWKPALQKFLSPDDFQVVFKDISAIKSCHQSFLTDLEAEGSSYGSKVAFPFIEFSNFFKVSQQYIANYPTINEILKGYEKNKKMKTKMAEVANSIDGRDLYSYLITPVQRMPRYLLFLRDLLKVTVQSHPDAELLSFAYESIDEVTKKIDKSTETSKNQQNLMKLQKLITNFTFLDKQRNLVFTTKISITDGNASKKGEILVFDDLLLVIKKGKTSKAIFDSPIQRFHFQSQRPDNLSITVDSTNKKYLSSAHRKSKQKGSELYSLKFANNEEMQKFFDEIERLQELEMFKFEKLSNQYIFKWNPTLLQIPLPSISSPFISAFEGSLLIISSKDESQASSLPSTPEVYRVALSNKTIFKAETKFPSFKHPISIATYKKNLYFINNDKFYKYDPKKNKLTTIQATFPPRVGHTSVFCGDNLLIFGGKSLQTNQLLNDLIVYNVARGVLMVVNPSETTPSPRWLHSSFGYKDKLYILGGETAGGSVDKSLYSFELETTTWTKVETTGDQLIPRKSGKAVTSGHYAIFIGGEVNNNKKNDSSKQENDDIKYINQPQIFNLKKKIIYTVENFGNVPDTLTDFDAVFSPNNNFSLCVITPNNLYNISTPAILQKSTSSKHFDESDEAKRRASQDEFSFFPFSSSKSKKSHHRSQSPHVLTTKHKNQDRSSLSFEKFKLGDGNEIDDHEKPLNDEEKLLLKKSESLDENIDQEYEEYNEPESDDLTKFKEHRKRGKTIVPLPPKIRASPQSSQERFVDLISQSEDEKDNEKNKKAELSICNAFPETLQMLRDENDEKDNNRDGKDIKSVQAVRKPSPKKIEKVMNISLFDKTENKQNEKENKTIQVEHKVSPNKIEEVANISLFDENKNSANQKERSINIQNDVKKTMNISFSFENQADDTANNNDDEHNQHHHHHHKKESKTIQVEHLTAPKEIVLAVSVSQFFENDNNDNDNNNENINDNSNQNIIQEKMTAERKINADDLKLNENMVFEIEEEEEEEHHEEKSEIPVMTIAATATITALLTAGAFYLFNRMRK